MKTLKLSIAFLFTLQSFTFNRSVNGIGQYLIKEKETIFFSIIPTRDLEVNWMNTKKAGYDGIKYEINLDTAHNITVQNISQATGPKQDELVIFGCSGSLTKLKENLSISFIKYRKKYFLINLDNSTLVGTFDSIIRVELKAETLKGKPAAYYCTQKEGLERDTKEKTASTINKPLLSVHIRAVPSNIKKKELDAKKHPPHTIGQFTKIEVEIQRGRTLTFPQGSYILCEGDSLSLQ